jgi:hypothetical protein
MRRVGDLRVAGIGIALFGGGVMFWLVPSIPTVLAGTAVAGVGIVWAIVAISTAYQKRSPAHMQGRVAAAANMLFSVPQTISIAVGAILVSVLDYRVELLIIGAVFLSSSVYLLTRGSSEPRLDAALA